MKRHWPLFAAPLLAVVGALLLGLFMAPPLPTPTSPPPPPAVTPAPPEPPVSPVPPAPEPPAPWVCGEDIAIEDAALEAVLAYDHETWDPLFGQTETAMDQAECAARRWRLEGR